MKIFALFFLVTLVSCSSTPKTETSGSHSEKEEGTISSGGGAPLIYWREGNIVVVKSCANASDLNMNDPKIAREKCRGKENRVTAEYFKEILTRVIGDKAAEKTKKEAAAAAAASAGGGGAPGAGAPAPSGKTAAEKLQEAQIEKQLEFLEAYNKDPNMLKDLRETSIKGVFNQKLKTQMDKTLDGVINNSAQARKDAAQDPDGILKEVLNELDPNRKKPCGIRGDIAERIESCASMPGSSFGDWKLVTRTKAFTEVWREGGSGLIWGQMLNGTFDHVDAVGQCAISREENGELDPGDFRLPTLNEMTNSKLASGSNPLFQKEFKFWTSTSEGHEVWVYDGATGKKELVSRSNVTKNKDGSEFSALLKLNARCVSRSK